MHETCLDRMDSTPPDDNDPDLSFSAVHLYKDTKSTLGGLQEGIVCADEVRYSVAAGVTYAVSVEVASGSKNAGKSQVVLSWELDDTPDNDMYANREPLEGLEGHMQELAPGAPIPTMAKSTHEVGEPLWNRDGSLGNHSVWYVLLFIVRVTHWQCALATVTDRAAPLSEVMPM